MSNHKQRDSNRETADALKFATTEWSAQEAWRAKLYTEKPSKYFPATIIPQMNSLNHLTYAIRYADGRIVHSGFKSYDIAKNALRDLMDKERADEDRKDSIRDEERSRNRKAD
jgi:hypothetical protein